MIQTVTREVFDSSGESKGQMEMELILGADELGNRHGSAITLGASKGGLVCVVNEDSADFLCYMSELHDTGATWYHRKSLRSGK